jgi:hypothetical protein
MRNYGVVNDRFMMWDIDGISPLCMVPERMSSADTNVNFIEQQDRGIMYGSLKNHEKNAYNPTEPIENVRKIVSPYLKAIIKRKLPNVTHRCSNIFHPTPLSTLFRGDFY